MEGSTGRQYGYFHRRLILAIGARGKAHESTVGANAAAFRPTVPIHRSTAGTTYDDFAAIGTRVGELIWQHRITFDARPEELPHLR